MADPYAVDKIIAHLPVLQDMRLGEPGRLITVHLMPQNTCNQSCTFCSYRLPQNKNSEAFDESAHLPWPAVPGMLDDFAQLGVRGVEVTGGGEPLAYPHSDELWHALNDRGFATALVTNGTILYKQDIEAITRRLKWARVSIDCAEPETYVKMRRAPKAHFDRAWEAVRTLREYAPDDPEFRLGVGFTLSNENLRELEECIRLAREYGADNIRLSVAFSSQGFKFFEYENGEWADDICALAEELAMEYSDDQFTVHNLISKRLVELKLHPTQDYRRCPTKDLICVVEGAGNVYTCCTLTGSKRGLLGNMLEHPAGFAGVWKASEPRRQDWDAREECPVVCLYRERNLAMNRLIDETPIHSEFI